MLRQVIAASVRGAGAAAALLMLGAQLQAAEFLWRSGAGAGRVRPAQFPFSREDEHSFRGSVAWDPCLTFRLPDGGIDARRLRYLEARIYSSTPADILDIYCQSPNGEWGLMGRHAIRKGWATYRVDLSTLIAHECSGSEASRRWGGAEGRVTTFRIDPGNEADRWVAVSSVRLTDEAMKDEVLPEPRGSLTSVAVQAPVRLTAGQPLRVSVTLRSGPSLLDRTTAWVRLMRGGAVLDCREQETSLRGGGAPVRITFATSKYLASGPLEVRAGAYELDDPPNTPAARIAFRNPREGVARPPKVTIRRVAGDPTIHVDGKPLAGMAYLVGTGRNVELHREFARAGIHLYTDWFGSSAAGDLGHVAPGRYDYGQFDSYFADILDADPQALFIPHVYVTPTAWWQKANPDEMCRFADGSTDAQSFASPKWRREIGDDLARLIAHLQRTSYADRILGYIVCSGHTAEWQQWGVWGNQLADYSESSRVAFRSWLRLQYGSDAALRAAWGQPDVTLATADLAPASARAAEAEIRYRTGPAGQQATDTYRFLSETVADAIVHFARVVKRASAGRSLAGTYYGYLTQHGVHQQDSGHLALAKVLDAPEVDFLMSPPMYTGREAGGTSTFMSATASVRLHGKLWLNESDIRTHLSHPGAGYGRTDTERQTRAVLLREFGETLARRTAISWFDMDGGWFSSPVLLRDMARWRRLADTAIATRRPFRPEIAVFICADSAYHMTPSPKWVEAVLTPVVELPRVGAPADVYLLSDITRPDFPDYKVYVFLNAAHPDARVRAAVEAKVRRKGVVSVWASACGEPIVSPTVSMAAWPTDRPINHVLGTHASLRIPVPGAPPALLRAAARAAGVHVYLDTDDAIDADGQWICIHARSAGAKTVRLPRASKVTDAMTGGVIATKATTVVLRMHAAETRLLRVDPP